MKISAYQQGQLAILRREPDLEPMSALNVGSGHDCVSTLPYQQFR